MISILPFLAEIETFLASDRVYSGFRKNNRFAV